MRSLPFFYEDLEQGWIKRRRPRKRLSGARKKGMENREEKKEEVIMLLKGLSVWGAREMDVHVHTYTVAEIVF